VCANDIYKLCGTMSDRVTSFPEIHRICKVCFRRVRTVTHCKCADSKANSHSERTIQLKKVNWKAQASGGGRHLKSRAWADLHLSGFLDLPNFSWRVSLHTNTVTQHFGPGNILLWYYIMWRPIYRLATGWKVRGCNPGGGEIFRTRPVWSWTHPASCTKGTVSFRG
jgi:hypothetical protein